MVKHTAPQFSLNNTITSSSNSSNLLPPRPLPHGFAFGPFPNPRDFSHFGVPQQQQQQQLISQQHANHILSLPHPSFLTSNYNNNNNHLNNYLMDPRSTTGNWRTREEGDLGGQGGGARRGGRGGGYNQGYNNRGQGQQQGGYGGQPQQQQQQQQQGGYQQGGGGGGQQGNFVKPNYSEPSIPGTRLYVGNLPYTANRDDVEDMFKSFNFEVVQVIMSVDPFTGRSPGYCFVDVASLDEAQRGINDLPGTLVHDRPVKVSPGVKRDRSQQQGQGRVNNRNQGYGNNNYGSGDGYSPSMDRFNPNTDASSHFEAPFHQTRLYIGGLPRIEPQQAFEQAIQTLFQNFQPTAISKIIPPPPAKASFPGNHHYGFVDFETAEETQAAIDALDGTESPWGGQLRVSLARDNSQRKYHRDNQQRNSRPWGQRNDQGGYQQQQGGYNQQDGMDGMNMQMGGME